MRSTTRLLRRAGGERYRAPAAPRPLETGDLQLFGGLRILGDLRIAGVWQSAERKRGGESKSHTLAAGSLQHGDQLDAARHFLPSPEGRRTLSSAP